LKSLEFYKPDSLFLTKLDEIDAFGQIISALNRSPIPLSYVAYGQQIPDDFEPASREVLGRYLFKSKEE
jgi:flagellar biosynthesis protein FlhF